MANYKKWKIDDNEDLPLAIIEDTENGYGVCELEVGVDRMKNAKLIVAAPDLLAACKLALPLIAGERITYDVFPPTDELVISLASAMAECEDALDQAITKVITD